MNASVLYADDPAIRVERLATALVSEYLSELKSLLRLGTISVHDTELTRHLKTALAAVEDCSGHYLGPVQITLTFGPGYVDYRVNQGPVAATATPTVPAALSLTNEPFPIITGIGPGVITYAGGWTAHDTTPAVLVAGVLELAANKFDGGNRPWRETIGPLCRKTWAD